MRVLRNLHPERVLVAALIAAVVAVPVASAADQALTAHHVARLRAVRQVAISPDGQQVAFAYAGVGFSSCAYGIGIAILRFRQDKSSASVSDDEPSTSEEMISTP